MTGQNGNSIQSVAKVPTNAWTHVVATFDGTTAKLYLNGTLDSTATWTGTRLTNSSGIHIGGLNGNDPLVGTIEEPRVYNRALTGGEAGELYQMGSYGTGQTVFDYDSVGNLLKVTDALSHSVSYAYDAMNRLTNRVDQLGRVEIYRYDKNGNVTNFVDRRNVSINFKYDALDRRTGVVYAATDSIRYFYDAVGRVTNVNDSIAGNIRLTYDSLDRLTQEFNNNGTVSYAYNDVGLRTNMTVTGENAVFYRYDAANRLTNVVQGTFTSSLTYDDAGRRTKLVLPNGINVLYSYDTASRLTNITYLAAVTNKIDYTYDQTGNRVSQLSALAIYNLPSTVSTSAYNSANQQLTFGSYSMLYDANGNATNIVSGTTTNKLLWSSRNQLTNMLGAVVSNFKYDGLGRRIERTVTGITEKYLYDGLDIIIQKDSGNNIRGRYFRGLAIDEPWQRIDITPGQGQSTTSTNRIYLADALGSIVALTDTNKVIQTEYDYEPFGATTTTGAGNKNSYKFTAREDDAIGLYYYRARYYHPALGRFASEDPIEYLGGQINLYAYVGNYPVNAIDALGLAVGDWWDARTYANTGFLEGWSAGALGEISSLPFIPDRWLTGYYRWGYGADVDCGAFKTGKYAGYAAQVLLISAGALQAFGASAAPEAITGFTRHGLNQVINRQIGPETLLNTVNHPLSVARQVDSLGRVSWQFIGENATVVLNAAGRVITVWP